MNQKTIWFQFGLVWFKRKNLVLRILHYNAPKGQKRIAQGIALGKIRIQRKRPARAKDSYSVRSVFSHFPFFCAYSAKVFVAMPTQRAVRFAHSALGYGVLRLQRGNEWPWGDSIWIGLDGAKKIGF